MRYSLLIFDLDGTLADSFPWFVSSLDDVADAFRLRRVPEHEIEPLRHSDAREIITRLGVPRWKLPMIARHMRKLKTGKLNEIALFPGVDGMLRALKDGGTKLALVSSDKETNARILRGEKNAALFSDYDCSAGLFGKVKKFRRVIRRAGVEPARVLAIGDEARDLEAARAIGIDFAAVTWGYTAAEKLVALKPDLTFRSIEEIPRRLLGYGAGPGAGTKAETGAATAAI